MRPSFPFSVLLGLSLFVSAISALPSSPSTHARDKALPTSCTNTTDDQYDYIVVGAGAGGGPLAARLALAGFSVLLIDAGHDVYNDNTTIPLYFPRSNEDNQIGLDYTVQQYPPSSALQVEKWYPRGSGIGGSTIHNALINVLQTNSDWDAIANLTNDSSWSAANMQTYFTKIENNLYIDPSVGTPAGHGYGGWLSTDHSPTNLLAMYPDQQLADISAGVINGTTPWDNLDYNAIQADGVPGGAYISMTKDSFHNRSSVRDHLVDTLGSTSALTFLGDTMVTRILTCTTSSGVTAYGVEYSSGAALLPIARDFVGKQNLASLSVTAKYEVIISAGVFQTPQLLLLSGIGNATELAALNITSVHHLPGVGLNLQDRLEIALIYQVNAIYKMFYGCEFGDDPSQDPCLADWIATNHTNTYSSGSGFWTYGSKSDEALPYLDLWLMWAPAYFNGYYPGYPKDVEDHPQSLSALFLKGHAAAKGWVKLTGNSPQDVLDINKNWFQTHESIKDRTIIREALKSAREFILNTTVIAQHIDFEMVPGANYTTDDELDEFINVNGWGHHACCTAKIGYDIDEDPHSVVNGDFQVHGVNNLRIVDNSVWPTIPGLFVTTPIYMISEKAADVILSYAQSEGWVGSTS